MAYLLFFALCLLGEAALHALLVDFVERPRLHKGAELVAIDHRHEPLQIGRLVAHWSRAETVGAVTGGEI